MALVGELLVMIGANNAPLMASLAQSEVATKGYASTAGTQHGLIAGGLRAVGFAASAMAAATVVGGALAARAAGDFQDQMAVINTIAHQTPAELTKTGDAIRTMAASTGTPLQDMTKAFYDLLSAGVPVSQAMSVLHSSSTLAIGGLATTAQTVDLLTTAINAYGLKTSQVAGVTDQFALAVQDGKVTADQIAASFADIAPTARNAGIGIDEISAAYASLTAQGVSADTVTTQMGRAILELQKPSADLAELQKKLGVSFADIAEHKGLVVALQQIRVAAEANDIPLSVLFGRQEAVKFITQTTGPHFAAYGAELARMHHAHGTAAAQAAERMGTFSRQTAILGETFNNLLITAGTPLLPFLTSLVQGVTDGINVVTAWAGQFPNLGAAMGSLVPAAGPVRAVIDGIGTGLGMVTSAIGSFVSIVSSFVGSAQTQAAAANIARTAIDGLRTVIGFLSSVVSVVVSWIGNFVNSLAGTTSTGHAAQTVIGALSTAGTILANVLQAVGTRVNAVVSWLVGLAQTALDNANKLGLFKAAGDLIYTLFGLLGTAIRTTVDVAQQLAAVISGTLSIAFAAIRLTIDAITAAIRTAIDAIKSMIDMAGKAVGAVSSIPGVKLGGDLAGGAGDAARNLLGALPHFDTGGIVPGSGPQLIVAHGGERVTPAGQGGAIHLHHTTVLQIGDERIEELIERVLYRSGSALNSGWAGAE